ncbi:MAG TPA: hypothetical protein VJT09_08260 [Pyrinomonadaceae bacterium]|nr:hypothetical protein [Pyrinomonadaceae bacterium]
MTALLGRALDSGARGSALKTVVYQSYRTTDVPGWISRSMQTVREWAALKGFAYVFVDDRLFDYTPAWYRQKVNNQIQLVSDLARLELAREFLLGEFERTIWVDADVVVFDADRLEIDVTEEYAFCHEVWVEKLSFLRAARRGLKGFRWGGVYCRRRVNNAVAVFTRGNSMLDFYIHACQRIVKNKRGDISNLEVGTHFLTELHRKFPLPLLRNIGLFSPHLMLDIATGGRRIAEIYLKEFGSPVWAANLCASYANKEYEGLTVGDDAYHTVLDRLLETGGKAVNGELTSAREP